MTEPLTLAIIIPTYGRVETLARLLRSIEAQTVAPSELIVVDQNAPGMLTNVVPTAATHLRLDDANAAAARNAGFLLSRSSHVMFVDDDEILESVHVERLLQTFAAHPEVRCIWPIVHDGHKLRAVRRVRRHGGERLVGSQLFRVPRAGSGGVAFERTLFRKLGGYDDLLFRFGGTAEDWELSRRMRRRDVAVWCDPTLFVEHTAEREGGCATRSMRYEDARTRAARATAFALRVEKGGSFRLRARDLPLIVRYALLSSLDRSDARRAVLRHPLQHLRRIVDAARDSRTYALANITRYEGEVDHFAHVPRFTIVNRSLEEETRSPTASRNP